LQNCRKEQGDRVPGGHSVLDRSDSGKNQTCIYPSSVRRAERAVAFLRRVIQHGRSRFDLLLPSERNAKLRKERISDWFVFNIKPFVLIGYLPQPYEQLIAVLRRMGHEHQIAVK
jgi:hypothetical protein